MQTDLFQVAASRLSNSGKQPVIRENDSKIVLTGGREIKGFWTKTESKDLRLFKFICDCGIHESLDPQDLKDICPSHSTSERWPLMEYKAQVFELKNGLPHKVKSDRQNKRFSHETYSQPTLF